MMTDINTLGQDVYSATPGSRWQQNGELDPHGNQYNCERAKLCKGDLTDDELANALYNCDHRRSLESMGLLTAGKERLRWLSRKFSAALAYIAELEAKQADPAGEIKMMGNDGILGAPFHGVVWNGGIQPPLGTKLYTVPPAQESLSDTERDAERYRKLQHWMSSNVKEGWGEVERLGAIACYIDHKEFDKYLDALPSCNVGLCEVRDASDE